MVLGNRPDTENVAPLGLGLNDCEPLVRGASAWALGQHDRIQALPLLQARVQIEDNHEVMLEMELVLQQWKQDAD